MMFGAVIIAIGLWIAPAMAEPFLPTNDNQVLEQRRVPRDPQARKLREWRRTLAHDPTNLDLAVRLAWRYRDIGRADADPRYYGYAQSALHPWWNQTNAPVEVLMLRATLRQALHDFDGALEDLSRLLALKPLHAQAWITKAIIHRVRGEYPDALRSCLPLQRLATPLMATACFSSVAGLNGRAEDAYDRLSNALRSPSRAGIPERMWAATILAEIAVRLGYAHEAERHFNEALAYGLRDTYALSAYADFLLDQGRPQEVRALLQHEVKVDGLFLRLALAERQLGSPHVDAHIETLRARFAASRRRGGTLHLRDEARFQLHLLDQPRTALALALENWALQREPADARLVLEAALKTGDYTAARPVVTWLNAMKLTDVTLQRTARQLQEMES